MPRTKLDDLVDVMESEEAAEEVKEEKTVKKPKKKTFQPSEGIKCRSVVQGGLFMDGQKTQMQYRWTDYGDEVEVEYRDLVAEVRTRSPFVFNPFFIVDDEDFINEFPQLKQFYMQSYSVRELRDILNLPVGEMVSKMKTLPKGAVESLKTIASSQVASGRLDSVKKIKALDEFFGTDLNLLQSLFQ